MSQSSIEVATKVIEGSKRCTRAAGERPLHQIARTALAGGAGSSKASMHTIPPSSRIVAACLAVTLSCAASGAAPLDDDVAAALMQHTNRLRAISGLGALTAEPRLTAAAQHLVEVMADSDRYGHDADGRQPDQRAQSQGYAYCLIAENIAFATADPGVDGDDLAAMLFDGWFTSPPHRGNILDRELTEVGIAAAHSARSDREYAVQLFGRPRSLAMRFDLTNATASTVSYQLGNQIYQLPAGATRSHQQCRQARLSLQGAAQTTVAASGAHYRIEMSAEGLRLHSD